MGPANSPGTLRPLAQFVQKTVGMELEVWRKRNSQRAALVGILLAVAFFVASIYLVAPGAKSSQSGLLTMLALGGVAISVLSWFAGISFYAMSKGYSWWLFFVLFMVLLAFSGYLRNHAAAEAGLISGVLLFGVPLAVVLLPDLDARRRKIPPPQTYQW